MWDRQPEDGLGGFEHGRADWAHPQFVAYSLKSEPEPENHVLRGAPGLYDHVWHLPAVVTLRPLLLHCFSTLT